jgi:hypothetical protein
MTATRKRTAAETAAYIAMLEDTAVAAACVLFGEVTGSKANYLTEGIHEMASEIVRTVPRLAGVYKGADR